VVYILQSLTSLLFRAHGYTYYSNVTPTSTETAIGYWYRRPTPPESDLPPLVIIHGIGSILSLIWFVTHLAKRASNRHIFVLDLSHISMRLPRPTKFPSAAETTAQITTILDCHVPVSSDKAARPHSGGVLRPLVRIRGTSLDSQVRPGTNGWIGPVRPDQFVTPALGRGV